MSADKYYLRECDAASGGAAPRLSAAVRTLLSVEAQHQVADLVAFPAHQLPWEPALQVQREVEENHGVLGEQEARS